MATRTSYTVTIDENGKESALVATPIWADTIAAEKHLRDNKLGKLDENPITTMTVMTYSALMRSGDLPAGTLYSVYESLIVGIDVNEAEEAPKSSGTN